jgi:hypothetical protein
MTRVAIDGGTPVPATPLSAPPCEIGQPEPAQLRRVNDGKVWSPPAPVSEPSRNPHGSARDTPALEKRG